MEGAGGEGEGDTLCKAAVLSPFPFLAIKCWKSDLVFIKRNTLWMNTGCQMETGADKAKNSLDKSFHTAEWGIHYFTTSACEF